MSPAGVCSDIRYSATISRIISARTPGRSIQRYKNRLIQLAQHELFIGNCFDAAAGGHQAVKDRLPALLEATIEAIGKFGQVVFQMFFRNVAVGTSQPRFEPFNDPMDSREQCDGGHAVAHRDLREGEVFGQ